MTIKAITIWILTSLTFISLAHFAEAICVVVLNKRALDKEQTKPKLKKHIVNINLPVERKRSQ